MPLLQAKKAVAWSLAFQEGLCSMDLFLWHLCQILYLNYLLMPKFFFFFAYNYQSLFWGCNFSLLHFIVFPLRKDPDTLPKTQTDIVETVTSTVIKCEQLQRKLMETTHCFSDMQLVNRSNRDVITYFGSILRAFAKFRKAAISFVISVSFRPSARSSGCPSAWNSSGPARRNFSKFCILAFLEILLRKFKCH